LREHIAAVAGRYADTAAIWDVVNEAVADDGTLRRTLWLERIGPDYLDIAFRAAAEAAPHAKLVYNDYAAEALNPKSDGIYRLLRELLDSGVPLHGVGFQCHLTDQGADLERFAQNLRRFADLGLELYVTEMDVRLPLPTTPEVLGRRSTAGCWRPASRSRVSAASRRGASPTGTLGSRVASPAPARRCPLTSSIARSRRTPHCTSAWRPAKPSAT
jgi:GH35 family endo-1,4-beta-xylanase